MTCQGSSAWRSSSLTPSYSTSPQNGKRNSSCASNHSGRKSKPCCARGRRARRGNPAQTIVRQHEAVVQRRAPADEACRRAGSVQSRAISARTSNCWARLMRALGGISKPRNSTRPSRPVGPSGENSLSMQISERWVLPVTSIKQVAEQPVDQPGQRCGALAGRRHLRQRDLQLVEAVVAGLVDARRLAGRADEQAGEQVGERRMALPVQHQALQQVRAGAGTGCRWAWRRRPRRGCRRRCRCGGRRS